MVDVPEIDRDDRFNLGRANVSPRASSLLTSCRDVPYQSVALGMSAYKVNNQRNDRHDEEKVNKSTRGAECKPPDTPRDEKYDE
jgi:hypothetical protein